MLKVGSRLVNFYDVDDYKRLLEAAGAIDARERVPKMISPPRSG